MPPSIQILLLRNYIPATKLLFQVTVSFMHTVSVLIWNILHQTFTLSYLTETSIVWLTHSQTHCCPTGAIWNKMIRVMRKLSELSRTAKESWELKTGHRRVRDSYIYHEWILGFYEWHFLTITFLLTLDKFKDEQPK